MNSEGLDALIITFVSLMVLAFGWFVVAIVQDRMRLIEAPETPKGEGNEIAHNLNYKLADAGIREALWGDISMFLDYQMSADEAFA